MARDRYLAPEMPDKAAEQFSVMARYFRATCPEIRDGTRTLELASF